MCDHYLLGEVGRISPEAPVPVVRVRSERHTAGGAGNVARNLAALGAKPLLLSAVGDDDAGRMLTAILEADGVEAILARELDRPTTIKTRIIAQNQQVVRVDRETEAPLSETGRVLLTQTLRRLVASVAVVVVSDYAKGVIDAAVMVTGLACACLAGCFGKPPPVERYLRVQIDNPPCQGESVQQRLPLGMRCAITGEPYTVLGYKGKQVRDNIHANDLVNMAPLSDDFRGRRTPVT